MITLPFPPSINRYWRSVRGRNILSRQGREYREEGLQVLAAQGRFHWPASLRLSVTITLCPPDRRRRDIDNFVKVPLDLLTHGGVYADDSQIDRLLVTRGPVEKGGRVTVHIEVIA